MAVGKSRTRSKIASPVILGAGRSHYLE
ncbi:hypothetical protein CCACVL1_22965 [Corchorus capsularis]|uniref:Uncharacterized protein n=1 Tax=Corchorus capsularis TaxID=210143 RepID=A0A1R3GVP9_COCAP|nr:hypothetical protein CCACVL1_22965 [Corchorus capsularis]